MLVFKNTEIILWIERFFYEGIEQYDDSEIFKEDKQEVIDYFESLMSKEKELTRWEYDS